MIAALIDTGASRSFVREGLFDSKMTTSPLTVRFGDGTCTESTSQVDLQVDIDPLRTKHTFFVLRNLPEDCILGMDFLSLHEITICPTSRQLWIGDSGRSIPFISDNDGTLFTLYCARDLKLPPRTQRVVPLDSNAQNNLCYISTARPDLADRGILIPRGLFEGRPTNIHVVNTKNHMLKLKKGATLAEIEIVEKIDLEPSRSKEEEQEIKFNIGTQLCYVRFLNSTYLRSFLR